MSHPIARWFLPPLGLVIAWLLASGCGSGTVAVGERADIASFRSAVNAGSDLDYNPAPSSSHLIEDSDAIIVGKVVDVQEAKQLYEDGAMERFAVLQIHIERTIHGTIRGDDSATVFVAMYASQVSPWSEIRASVPLGRALLVLTDLADWNYSGRLEGFPEVVYFPRPDGLWFEDGSGKPEGVWAEVAEVEARWDFEFTTLDDLIHRLEEAAEQG